MTIIDPLSVMEFNERYNDNLSKAEALFKNGEMIKTTYFIGLCDMYGIKIHSKTRNWAHKNMVGISKNACRYKGSYTSAVILKHASELANAIAQTG